MEPIEINQEALDKMIARLNDFAESMTEVWEQFLEEFQPVYETILKIVENLTRNLFIIRLMRLGIPFDLAGWLAYKWPLRWLPVHWIYDINYWRGHWVYSEAF